MRKILFYAPKTTYVSHQRLFFQTLPYVFHVLFRNVFFIIIARMFFISLSWISISSPQSLSLPLDECLYAPLL